MLLTELRKTEGGADGEGRVSSLSGRMYGHS